MAGELNREKYMGLSHGFYSEMPGFCFDYTLLCPHVTPDSFHSMREYYHNNIRILIQLRMDGSSAVPNGGFQ